MCKDIGAKELVEMGDKLHEKHKALFAEAHRKATRAADLQDKADAATAAAWIQGWGLRRMLQGIFHG